MYIKEAMNKRSETSLRHTLFAHKLFLGLTNEDHSSQSQAFVSTQYKKRRSSATLAQTEAIYQDAVQIKELPLFLQTAGSQHGKGGHTFAKTAPGYFWSWLMW